jgi:hypothetical protein
MPKQKRKNVKRERERERENEIKKKETERMFGSCLGGWLMKNIHQSNDTIPSNGSSSTIGVSTHNFVTCKDFSLNITRSR